MELFKDCKKGETGMLKAVVMDMDGTLLNSNNEIDPKTKATLRYLASHGTKVVLASGRSYTRLLPYAKELGLDETGGYLIEVDGLSLYETRTGKRNKKRMFKPVEIADIYDYIVSQTSEVHAMEDDGMFDAIPIKAIPIKRELRRQLGILDDADPYPWTAGPWGWLNDARSGYPNIRYISNASQIDADINKLQIMDDQDALAKLFANLQNLYGDQFAIYRTTPTQLEVLPKGISKGAAVAELMEANGWNRDEVLTFGDGENDVSMFDVVTDSYAMDNAAPYVKEKAAHICPSHDEAGIYETLKERGDIPSDLVKD